MSNTSGIGAVLEALAEVISARAAQASFDSSYTAKLLSQGPARIAKKVIEEAGELGVALVAEGDGEVASEAADVLYHMLVGLEARGVSLDDVARVLAGREGLSGLEEKARR